MPKPTKASRSMDALDQEIRRLRTKAKGLEQEIDENFTYFQQHSGSLFVRSLLPRKMDGEELTGYRLLDRIMENERLQKVLLRLADILAEKFGEPEFVKIDVEGFEINVLRGMSFRPRYLSFEFGARRKGPSTVCLEHLGDRNYRFRPIVGRQYRFATPEWMDLAEAKSWLEDFSVDQAEYGDMFAHRV